MRYEIDEFNDILDALGRRMDSEMTEALLKVASERGYNFPIANAADHGERPQAERSC